MRGPVLIFFAVAAVSTGCASTGATPRPFPTPGPHASAPPRPGSDPNGAILAPPNGTILAPTGSDPAAPPPVPPGRAEGYSVTGTALSLRGTPYRNGGSDPSGFDCSGFVRYVFERNGVAVPRTVSEQFRTGREVDGRQLEPGDLVFFTTVSPGATHVGIAIGGDEFIHAPSRTGEVRVERMSGPYWSTRFVGARRLL